jgi:hypothetical protein
MSGIIFKNHKTEQKSLCEVSMKPEEGWEEVVIWNYVNIYRRMGGQPPLPHSSVCVNWRAVHDTGGVLGQA